MGWGSQATDLKGKWLAENKQTNHNTPWFKILEFRSMVYIWWSGEKPIPKFHLFQCPTQARGSSCVNEARIGNREFLWVSYPLSSLGIPRRDRLFYLFSFVLFSTSFFPTLSFRQFNKVSTLVTFFLIIRKEDPTFKVKSKTNISL